MPCTNFEVIVSGLYDENINFTYNFGEIFVTLRMGYEVKVGLCIIVHLPSEEQNDFLIKLSCFLPCDLSLVMHCCISVVCLVLLNYSFW